jgi:transposase
MRYGLISNYRRSWSPIGVRTIIDNQQSFSNRYLFSAVSPITGDSFHLIGLEGNTSTLVSCYLDKLEDYFKGKHIVLVFDNAPSHRPTCIHNRKNLTCIFLPPYSPELNPAERFFGEVRKSTANQIFESIDAQEAVISAYVKTLSDDEPRMQRLLGYDWIVKQWKGVS